MKKSVSSAYTNDNVFGKLEIIIKDKNGNVIDRRIDHNIIKIFMKDHIPHTLAYPYVWDPTGGTGEGDWVANVLNHADLYHPKYIILGAAFDTSPSSYGSPLSTNDADYYETDPISGQKSPKTLYSGAEYGGGLIKPIPIKVSDGRPLKRIESATTELATYQPPGTPYLRNDVRALFNVLKLQTTLEIDEYNGFSDTYNYFDICEVALVSGPAFGASVSDCDCDPEQLFLLGDGCVYNDGGATTVDAMEVTLTAGSTILTLSNADNADCIYPGDQIKLIAPGYTQTTQHYLVYSKSGNQLTLDRVPKDDQNVNLPSGTYTMWVDRHRILCHRILESPFSKTSALEVTIIWNIYYS